MSASFRKIDYSLRPAKHAERKMLSEIFRRLRPFQPVEDYTYVGLGSIWFTDFSLFHRALGVKDMRSIEREKNAKARVEANKPFSTITVAYDEASVVLPELDWSKRSFVWLDYDDPLAPDMLLDSQIVASHAASGTVLAVSVQCQQAREVGDAQKETNGPTALERFRDQFGRESIPQGVCEDDLYGWPLGNLSRRMIEAKIQAALAVRNIDQDVFSAVSFIPICSIEYKDGACMTTVVGIFVEGRELGTAQSCGFETLDFLTTDGKPIRIQVPVLTIREIRHIERQLPQTDKPIDYGSIPPSDADHFAEFYRYLPNFATLDQ
ncbi:O-methyltransferase [Acidipila rosea]|uniref:Uncharacterized protein n=1 Tax=Acidipila rosea TaxID=768535 RepID=A0A4R1KTG5_9BACT|nr:O-methyltransferase [Acidipila rosea]TCK68456.1 hypothetical protein C7378_3533 [Acidipila rosea]